MTITIKNCIALVSSDNVNRAGHIYFETCENTEYFVEFYFDGRTVASFMKSYAKVIDQRN